ncbi:hypothetical protein D8M04_16170 [Oceanobacillus piezotolerans]|uniref:Amidinotransferase n=1 Tax=Oceanobacillus piezotolerans TaxID=2448030 RepID=A0A498D630_9BACI|nr:arginine deiminase family protein [Oceanobacillus piezotolerans]RLL42115.1 hypothetical protein D8M04_16170 [Oceanobacillus piezotolerans]
MKQITNKSKSFVQCFNEYDELKQVIVVPPTHMRITEVINTTQRHYLSENINIDKALQQHQFFVQTLIKEGAEVIPLETEKELNEQVFTRDIGFTIGDTLFLASLKSEIRKPELKILQSWLDNRGVSYTPLQTSSIEGGDVILDNDRIWLGVSDRTSSAAIHQLKGLLTGVEVHMIPIDKSLLHLDCVFNPISKNTALIYSKGIDPSAKEEIQKHFELIDLEEEEQFRLATNVLSIGNNKIISLPENKRVNEELTKRGYKVIEVPFSEIIKSGGSFRCCTLPTIRQSS